MSREDTLAEPDGVSAVDATEQTESTDAGDGASQQDDPAPTPSTTQLIAPATTAPAADVAATVAGRPEHVNVILTGRDMADEVVEVADTVTEMVKVKHAFDRKIRAKKGIDY